MSDRADEIARNFEENVLRERRQPQSYGLFTIPEYPEFDRGPGMWSTALDVILTSLRYLAPATILTLFWGQQNFIFKLLRHIDSAIRSVVSNNEQKVSTLKWLEETALVRVDSLETVWQNGWILCGVLHSAMPGACAGHPPTRLSLKHAQSIASNYLDVEPVFSRQELESNDSLSKHQEWKLLNYLDRIRQSLSKLTPPYVKPIRRKSTTEITQFTFDYVARGTGLTVAQLHNRMYFKIYPTAQQCMDPGEVTVLIRGPKDTYGITVLPPILGKAQMIRQTLLGLKSGGTYTHNALPLTQGATYLRAYGRNDMNKTYFVPKAKYDIDIEVDTLQDHVRIGYIVKNEGNYEISITSQGQNIVGSPFTLKASINIIDELEKESFRLEDGEEIDIVDVNNDKKVVLRIVDFVTEKMLLKEDGSLEKISEEEAKQLMSSKKINYGSQGQIDNENLSTLKICEHGKLKKTANNILIMKRVCNLFCDVVKEKRMNKLNKDKVPLKPRRKQGIPDVVNSTLAEITKNPFFVQKNKLITPENISVSICTEKSKYINGNEVNNETKTKANVHKNKILDEDNDIKILKPREIEYNELTSLDIVVHQSSNPFLSNTTFESSYLMEKDLGSFVKTEYETNNSQNEETDSSLVKIFIQKESHTPSPVNNNPFIEPDIISLERPKTPILKIITGEVKNRDDSVYLQPTNTAEEILKNKPTNPFLATPHYESIEKEEKLAVTDFIIGAPVSLPPIIKASSPEPDMGSFIISDKNFADEYTTEDKERDNNKDTNISTLLSNQQTLELKPSETKIQDNISNIGNLDACNVKLELEQDNFVRKKELWDSAYVSIDDNNSTADSNNNDHTPLYESPSTQRASSQVIYEYQHEDLANMGPAEREIWLSELSNPSATSYHDIKPIKLEMKKPIFTPILEEKDQNESRIAKNPTYQSSSKTETDSVAAAFADLDDIYCEYFPEQGNIPVADTDVKSATKPNKPNEYKNTHVDSASDIITDVKRCAKSKEGEISEVQVTESVSASRILHSEYKEQLRKTIDQHTNEVPITDNNHTSIVIEKKKYWDEKIREIEAAEEEERKSQQKIRRNTSKTMRQSDSLSKKKGRQMVKNFLTSGGNYESRSKSLEKEIGQESKTQQEYPQIKVEEVQNNIKLVEKWKQYWDNKLMIEREEKELSHLIRAASPQHFTGHNLSNTPKDNMDKVLPKQELSEEVFKAFETSPKRFFGTSRKQILNKIDSFLGKQSSIEKFLPTEVSNASLETGLVSSRITLFHDISNTEELAWKQRNCKSLHNIFQRINNTSKNSSQDRDVNVEQDHKLQTEESEHCRKIEKLIETNKSFTTEDKRARFKKDGNSLNFEDISATKTDNKTNLNNENGLYVKKISRYDSDEDKKASSARKISTSKSEMDIFNKISQKTSDDDLDKHKSYEELQKTKVKTFISLYENVSKTPLPSKHKNMFRKSESPQQQLENTNCNSIPGPANKIQNDFKKREHQSMSPFYQYSGSKSVTPTLRRRKQWVNNKSSESDTTKSIDTDASIDYIEIEIIGPQDESGKQSTYLRLSDMELEIIENPETTIEPKSVRNEETLNVDHKSRFETAKQYFKSLEELRVPKKFHDINECEKLIYKSTESLKKDRTPRRVKKNIKYNSVPSSDIAKAWKELQEKENESSKLVKISEKFNVDDLYNDIMDGRLSRQGSLRGIPHKKAVLETFKSMENLSDNKLSSYEIPASHVTEFDQGKIFKNAQTYLTEYPYLPMTDPSRSQSRLDTKASGLISMKELLQKRPRRNSVPNLKLNSKESFTVDL